MTERRHLDHVHLDHHEGYECPHTPKHPEVDDSIFFGGKWWSYWRYDCQPPADARAWTPETRIYSVSEPPDIPWQQAGVVLALVVILGVLIWIYRP